jgi:hypothetical protein
MDVGMNMRVHIPPPPPPSLDLDRSLALCQGLAHSISHALSPAVLARMRVLSRALSRSHTCIYLHDMDCPPDRRFACAKRVSSAAPVARQLVKQTKMQRISDRVIAKMQSYRQEIGPPRPVTLQHSVHFCDAPFETFFNGNCFLAFFSARGPPLTAGRS